ncbi:hypothetical protein JCM5350_002819 [Sporobolomyces pararoseus]
MTEHARTIAQCKRLIPPLSPELHKGQAGRVGVIGGSKDYAGAPYFASMTALRMGADLSHVICEPAAGNVIKTYSPDLIVHTDLGEDVGEDKVTEILKGILHRLHTLVIGPGLGRSKHMQLAARVAIKLARENNVYIVIDADGLFLVQTDPSVVKGYKRVILTPNVVEFGRLVESCGLDKNTEKSELAAALSRALDGPTIVQKGAQDRITNGHKTLISETTGSSRRCGGQGDVLSGAVGTFLAWGKNYEERKEENNVESPISPEDITLYAAYGASTLTRTASRLCFADYKRAMQTGEMLGYVGKSFEEVFGSDSVTDQAESIGVLSQVGGIVEGLKKSIL